MTDVRAALHARLGFLADVVTRESRHLALTDARLFAAPFGLAEVLSLNSNPDLAERVDAFVARFGRLQDTLAGALLPRLLEALLEPVGTGLDNLNRAERLGWIRSAREWAELRLLRNRTVAPHSNWPARRRRAGSDAVVSHAELHFTPCLVSHWVTGWRVAAV